MSSPSTDPDQPIAWRVVTDGTPVETADGARLGRVVDVLGADQEDIFHGLAVKPTGKGPECVLLAERITLMSPARIVTDLSAADFAALPPYHPEATFRLGISGLLRKHEGWIKGG